MHAVEIYLNNPALSYKTNPLPGAKLAITVMKSNYELALEILVFD